MKVNKCSFTSNDDSLSFETNDQAVVCSQLLEHAGRISAENPPGISTQGWQPALLPGPGTKPAPKGRCHGGEGAGTVTVPTLCHKPTPSPSPRRGCGSWTPALRRVPELQTDNKTFQEPSDWIPLAVLQVNCSLYGATTVWTMKSYF